ncbi:hypothetical protein LguiA_002768 [Lonicera macranthoides]
MALLLGPPSSGKTTLLLALAGKLDPSLKVRGEITYKGHELKEFVPQKTSAYISQNDVHVGEMTMKETVDFSASNDLAKEFLKTQDVMFSSRPVCLASEIVSGGYLTTVLSPMGEQWKKMRRILATEILSKNRHKWLMNKRNEEADHLIHYVYNQTCCSLIGGIVNVRATAQHYCGNVIRKMIFGKRFFGAGMQDGGPGAEEEEHISALFTILKYTFSFCVSDYVGFLRKRFDLDGQENIIRKAVESVRKYQDLLIDKRAQQWAKGTKTVKEDLLDVMLSFQEEDGQGKILLLVDEIKAQVIEMMAASVDNTSNAVEWAIAEMINQTAILQKAVEELDKVVGTHSHVLLSRLGLGRNPRIWDDPLTFNLERHLRDDSTEVALTESEFRLLSFSSGRRGCVGVLLGSTMTTMLLARLLQCFTWSAPAAQPCINLNESYDSLVMANPLHALARPRLGDYLYHKSM